MLTNSKKNNQILIGSHVSFTRPQYLIGSIKQALSYDANTFMIYLGPPQNARRIDPKEYQIEQYQKEYHQLINPQKIVIHGPYIINPANITKSEFAQEYLEAEIARMNTFGAKYLVIHPGASLKFPRQDAIECLVITVKNVLEKTKNVVILLETMSGKGTELGSSLQEISTIIKKINHPRVGVCLDTCHLWDSGVDIDNLEKFQKLLIDNHLLDKVKVIHINDSKNDKGSKKDRHANIGKGKIGTKTLKEIVHAPFFKNVLMILETPWVDDKPLYKEEIALLKGSYGQ